MIIPAIYSLFELKGISLNNLKPNIKLGVSILKGIIKELDLNSWDYVFTKIYSPFTLSSIEILKLHKQKTGSETSQQIVAVLSKILKETLNELFQIVKNSELANEGLIEKYLQFLKNHVLGGDAVIFYFNFRKLLKYFIKPWLMF